MQTRGRRSRGRALAFWSLVGAALGCAGGSGKSKQPDGWFDACCTTCSEGHCSDCSETKGECNTDGGEIVAECLLTDDVLMCREKPAT